LAKKSGGSEERAKLAIRQCAEVGCVQKEFMVWVHKPKRGVTITSKVVPKNPKGETKRSTLLQPARQK